jgi:hypothetical protein
MKPMKLLRIIARQTVLPPSVTPDFPAAMRRVAPFHDARFKNTTARFDLLARSAAATR